MSTWRHKAHQTLRWSERYTKTDMVYLAKGSVWLTFSQAVASISSLLLAIAFANLLPAETYGNYRYVLSIMSVLMVATFPGINTAAIKGVASGDETSFWRLLQKKLSYSLLATVLSGGVALYYLAQGNITLALSVMICAVSIPLVSASGMYEALLNGRRDFRRLAYSASAVRILNTLSILLFLFFSDNLLLLIVVYFVPEIILQSLFLYRLRPSSLAVSSNTTSLGRYGFHLSLMEVLKTVAGQIDKLLIFHYLGAAQLAVYIIATSAPGQIKSLLQNMSVLALPKLSASDTPETIRQTLPGKMLRLEVLILLAVAAYWVVSPLLFPLFFPKYTSALLLSQVYALSLLFFPRTFFSTAMTAHMKQKELYAVRIIAPLIRIGVFALMLPVWGIWGAVCGSIIGNGLNTFVYQYYFHKAFPLPSTST